ncbi:MAG: hypothetical protein EXS47_01470 [Candidatus Zambryskibacteria bacterium]|nr:hypothetical protein [Candidatus Zambryskibacteria bacterium]
MPKNKYIQILNTQEKLRDDLTRLQKIVTYIAQDEVSPRYLVRLSRIEKGLSADKGIRFKNVKEIKKFFRSL